MAAQTQQQWYDKISRWVPSWWFENKFGKNVTQAIFWGAAAIYQQIEQDMMDSQQSTFILDSAAPILDLLGDEREQVRTSGQSDASFRPVVQNCLFRNVGYDELLILIKAQLVVTAGVWLFQNQQEFFFDDPDISETNGIAYFDDYWTRLLESTKTYNWWTLIVPIQTGGVDATIMANLVSIIKQNAALGTTYDILYLSSSDTDTND